MLLCWSFMYTNSRMSIFRQAFETAHTKKKIIKQSLHATKSTSKQMFRVKCAIFLLEHKKNFSHIQHRTKKKTLISLNALAIG